MESTLGRTLVLLLLFVRAEVGRGIKRVGRRGVVGGWGLEVEAEGLEEFEGAV